MKPFIRYSLAIICAFLLFSERLNAAESYRMVLGSDYFHFEDDDNSKQEGYNLVLRQYFRPVNTARHPLAEAAFIERIGSGGLFVSSSTFDRVGTLGTLKGDRLNYGVFATLREPGRPMFLELLFSKADSQFDTIIIGDQKTKRYALALGFYVQDAHTVSLEYAQSETDTDLVPGNTATSQRTSYALKSKVLNKLGLGRAVNLQGEVRRDEFQNPTNDGDNLVFALESDYYFNRSVSLGGRVATDNGDNAFNEGETYGVRLEAFLIPSFSLGFSFEKFLADNAPGVDDALYLVTLALRL